MTVTRRALALILVSVTFAILALVLSDKKKRTPKGPPRRSIR